MILFHQIYRVSSAPKSAMKSLDQNFEMSRSNLRISSWTLPDDGVELQEPNDGDDSDDDDLEAR